MKTLPALLVSLAILLSTVQADASISNLGVSIAPNGTQTVVPFFDGSSVGREINGPFSIFFTPYGAGEKLTITVDAASVFGYGSIVAAELFIDAFDVDFFNSSVVTIQGVVVGSLDDTANSSEIPVATGPVGTHVMNNLFDVDNTFFDLSAFLVDLATDSTFTIEIENTTLSFFGYGEGIRVDGINIQANVLSPVDPSGVDAPEPYSVLVWSVLSWLGCCAAVRRRQAISV